MKSSQNAKLTGAYKLGWVERNRTHYAANLKREMPRIPHALASLPSAEAGKRLALSRRPRFATSLQTRKKTASP